MRLKVSNYRILVGLFLPVIFFCACNNALFDQETRTDELETTIQQALSNAEYPLEMTINGKAKLSDGFYEEQAAPGSATKIKVSLSDHQSLGDLNGDGEEDAAVILVVDPGGSGTFYYLSAVIFENNNPLPIDTSLIGDRVLIDSVVIEDGQVMVNLFTRLPDDPITAEPSVEVVYKFIVQDGQLVAIQ